MLKKLLRGFIPKEGTLIYSFFGFSKFSWIYVRPNAFSQYMGTYEEEVLHLVKKYTKNANIIWDIGGSFGYYSSYFTKHNKQVAVVEPDYICCEALKKLNAKSKYKFTLIQKKLSGTNDNENISVDKLLEDFGLPDFIKIDVDGGEEEVFNNCDNLISKSKTTFLIETHSQELEDHVLKQFNKNPQYKCFVIDRSEKTKAIRSKSDFNKWLICEPN